MHHHMLLISSAGLGSRKYILGNECWKLSGKEGLLEGLTKYLHTNCEQPHSVVSKIRIVKSILNSKPKPALLLSFINTTNCKAYKVVPYDFWSNNVFIQSKLVEIKVSKYFFILQNLWNKL